jgi:hypothetical protein
MASAEEETLWLSEVRPKLSESGFSLAVVVMIVMGVLTAAVVLGAVISSTSSMPACWPSGCASASPR